MHGMSSNGQYVTGLSWVENCSARGYIWSRATNTTVMLPSLNGESARGNGVTNDGDTVVGFNQKECGWRRGAMWVDGNPEWIDGLGENEAKLCSFDDSPCCANYDCPDFVDAFCDNTGSCDKTGVSCVNSVCVGGASAGQSCYGSWSCDGYCTTGPNTGGACGGDYECPGTCDGGPNNGNSCTGSGDCPDVDVCLDNPDYNPTDTKGEAYTMSPDGNYVAGTVFGESDWQDPNYDPYLWASGYRMNPDGSFTQLLPPPDVYPDGSWTPIDMSDDGSVIGGKFGSFWSSYPVLWTEETGTMDIQYFLVAQGLDDLYFWYIQQVNAVRADGEMIGGYGTNYVNPDCHSQWGCTEGWVAGIAKASVCHKGDFDPETGQQLKGRTLTIAWDSIGDHLGHGDELATCEFLDAGGARAADMRQTANPNGGIDPNRDLTRPTEEEMRALRGLKFGAETATDQSVQQDDDLSSPGPAVQREESRRRVRR
jgi:hypothetical protein